MLKFEITVAQEISRTGHFLVTIPEGEDCSPEAVEQAALAAIGNKSVQIIWEEDAASTPPFVLSVAPAPKFPHHAD